MTHDELTEIGKRVLRNWFKCPIVISELVTAAGETPDVFGLRDGGLASYLIECKTSRSDFFVDQKKPWRQPGKGLGVYRFYLAPEGVLKLGDIPANWGFIEVLNSNGKPKLISGKDPYRNCDSQVAQMNERDMGMEMMLMYSLLSRIKRKQNVEKYFN